MINIVHNCDCKDFMESCKTNQFDCELDRDYFEDQEERYQNHISQGDLFDIKEIQESIYKE